VLGPPLSYYPFPALLGSRRFYQGTRDGKDGQRTAADESGKFPRRKTGVDVGHWQDDLLLDFLVLPSACSLFTRFNEYGPSICAG
jgi:hypothetical protein